MKIKPLLTSAVLVTATLCVYGVLGIGGVHDAGKAGSSVQQQKHENPEKVNAERTPRPRGDTPGLKSPEIPIEKTAAFDWSHRAPEGRELRAGGQPADPEKSKSGRGRPGSLDSAGGPDGFDYRFVDNQLPDTATYNWIELRGQTGVTWVDGFTSPDEGYATAIPLGFTFTFYDSAYTTMTITTNGTIQFTNSFTTWRNSCLPAPAHEAAIFLYWDDLDITHGGIPSGSQVVGVKNFGSYTVVEFDSVGHYDNTGGPTTFKFEAILFANGRIKFQYNLIQPGSHARETTIGIQGTDPGHYLEYTCNGAGSPIQAGRAIWFFRPTLYAHDFRCLGLDMNLGCVGAPGESDSVIVLVQNIGSSVEAGLVKYRLGNGSIRSESTAILAPYQREVHTFALPVVLPATAGMYTLRVWTDLANDADRANDTIQTTVTVPSCSFLECAENDSESHADYDCNGGCNVLTPSYQDILCGQTVCGVCFTYGDYYRDTDWYRFTVTERSTISATITAEFSLQFGLGLDQCPPDAIFDMYEYDPCVERTIMIPCLAPGDYVLFVASDWWPDLPLADSARYWLSLDCRPAAFSPPANDDCANAGLPVHLPAVFSGNNVCATHDCALLTWGLGETWHSFILDTAASVEVNYCDTQDDWNNYVSFLLSDCPCMNRIDANARSYCVNGNAILRFLDLDAGTYYLPVLRDDMYNAAGVYTVTVTTLPSGSHSDDTVAAPGQWSGTTCNAGNDCWFRDSEDRQYQITLPNAGNWTFSLCQEDADFYSHLYLTSECCGGRLIADNDEGCDDSWGPARISGVPVEAGVYYLTIEGDYGDECGEYTLTVYEEQPCVPDYVVSAPGIWTGNTCPLGNRCWRYPSSDVTYSVTIPYRAPWTFSLCDPATAFRTRIYLTDECCGGNLIVEDGEYCAAWGAPSYLPRVMLDAGTYFVTIEGQYQNDCGPYLLDVHEWIPCAAYQSGDVVECAETDSLHPMLDCNNGCGEDYHPFPPRYQEISCGQTVFGRTFTPTPQGSYRDWDWYWFHLAEAETIRVNIIAEFPAAAGIDRRDSCHSGSPIGYATQHVRCAPFSVSTPGAVGAGDYVFWITPMTYDGLPLADSLHYRAALACAPLSTISSWPTVVESYTLYQNVPNPFNPNTEIRFDLPVAVKVELKVFNTLGQEVVTLVDEVRQAGAHRVVWNGINSRGSAAASGLYIYTIRAGDYVDFRKMVLLR